MQGAAECRLVKGCEKRVRRALCCEGGGVERVQQAAHAALCRAAVPLLIAPIVNISIGSIATVAIDMRFTIHRYDTTFRLNMSSQLPRQKNRRGDRRRLIQGRSAAGGSRLSQPPKWAQTRFRHGEHSAFARLATLSPRRGRSPCPAAPGNQLTD